MSSRTAPTSSLAASSRALMAGLRGVFENRPPSQYDRPSILVIGKLGGKAAAGSHVFVRQAPATVAVEVLDLTGVDSGGPHQDASFLVVEHLRIHELGQRLPQRCGVIDARGLPWGSE